MGFRFHRSVGVVPGVRINFSKGLPSLSLGRRGLHYTIGGKGTRLTAGLPGTGMSYTDYEPYRRAKDGARRAARHTPLFGLMVFAGLMLAMWAWSVAQDQAPDHAHRDAAHLIR